MNICVFCGSRNGRHEEYAATATNLGKALAESGHRLIYGGGDIGLMGACANACLAAGGEVIGYIPERLLDREVGHRGLTQLEITRDMFDRKSLMIEQSDAFIILPGGLGTLDEFFEVITLKQLGYHDKPIIVLNQNGMWTPLLDLVDQVVAREFADASVQHFYETIVDESALLQWVKRN